MGRKKKYNRDTLIEKSMGLFRDQGFLGTSTQKLVEELGVNRYSLYAEFGNKQNLFELALDRYNREVIERNFGELEKPAAGVKEIRELLLFYGMAGKGPASGRGCLLCNTAVEFGPLDPTGAGFVQKYFQYLSGAFYKALSNAQGKGEIRKSVALKKTADFFTASTLGLFVMIRAKAPSEMIENAAAIVIEHLEGLSG